VPRSALQVTQGFNAFVTVTVKVILGPDIAVEVRFGATLTVIAEGVALGVAVSVLYSEKTSLADRARL